MHAIGFTDGFFVLYLVLLLPAVAIRSARVFNPRADRPARRAIPPLSTIYLNTIFMLLSMLALAWVAGPPFGSHLFAMPVLGVRQLLAGAGALVFQLAMLFVSHTMRPAGERRDMLSTRMLPQSGRERVLYSVTAVLAGISEEAAYRGVLVALLSYALGSAWTAVFISALAFALGHAVQGWKSAVVIFFMACAMHALVWYTGTLVIAMAVHAIYDLLVPTVRRRIWPAPPTGPERIAG